MNKMGIGSMRYKELLKKVPEGVELEIEGNNGDVRVKVAKSVKRKAVDAIPAMF